MPSINSATWMLAALMPLVVGAGQAKATTYEFSFSYSGTINCSPGPFSPVSGSGDLFGTPIGGGEYSLTGGSGTSTEAGSLSLEPVGTYTNTLSPSVNLCPTDNLLFTSSDPVLDGNGIVFVGSSLPSNSKYFSIWGNGPGNYSYFNNYDAAPTGNNYYAGGSTSFSAELIGTVATPLPSTWTMLIAGFVGFGFFAYRGSKNRSAAVGAA